MSAGVVDRLGRPLRNLRLSVTDRCNLRCAYCMPEEEYRWLPREDLLTHEETARLAGIFLDAGVERVRLTGGEPLLRRDLDVLIRLLAAQSALRDLSMTTNGVLLAGRARALREAGLHRVTVSLDTLRPERFRDLARRGDHGRILAGLREAGEAGFRKVKINTVVMRGVNDDELSDMLAFGRESAAEVRFIEYMDVGGATGWSPDRVVSKAEILASVERRHGPAEPAGTEANAPADRFMLADGTSFGVIASTTSPFCRSCDRSRVTADGHWLLCLYARAGIDLRGPLRDGVPAAELRARIEAAWRGRRERGAEERLATIGRTALHDRGELRDDPHLEMHTRGG